MATESTLTQSQKESIEIEKFIFHIIIVENDEPIYLDEVELTEAQKIFFKNRISEVAEGTQYNFIDKEHNTLAMLCQKLNIDNINFIDKSKIICNDFKSHHRGSMTDGAFIISTFSMLNTNGIRITLIALLKMDQKKVLEYELEVTEEGRKAIMREIADSFIESKDAVQKVAIVDISGTFAWDILAKERKKAEGIADYFRNFLNAQMRDTPSILTRKTVHEVSKWSKINVDLIKDIPEFTQKTSDPASYFKSRAVSFMNANEGISFDANNFIQYLFALEELSEESSQKVVNLQSKIETHLIHTGIHGQVFIPKPNSITKTVARTKKRTEEGVLIEWQGNPEDKGISIENLNDQRKKITIITSTLEDLE
ncbi:nucleoid-associated protein [Aliarcobacter butzleri]|uniref:nucleoid-associated protein n=1 Tax=Aliarcobacter butzleri TaxID=28197 RepID=UPI002B2480BF|nr:nucleoid-associated protein [Aliarcobacter butzleri]